MFTYKKSQTASALLFNMVLTADHYSPALGLMPTVLISKNGAAFAAPVGAITELGLGWYKVTPNIADFDTVGPLLLHATAATADATDAEYEVTTGLVTLAPSQIVDIIGNVSGSVGSVLAPVTCRSFRRRC